MHHSRGKTGEFSYIFSSLLFALCGIHANASYFVSTVKKVTVSKKILKKSQIKTLSLQ
jgi:hypothetical protein